MTIGQAKLVVVALVVAAKDVVVEAIHVAPAAAAAAAGLGAGLALEPGLGTAGIVERMLVAMMIVVVVVVVGAEEEDAQGTCVLLGVEVTRTSIVDEIERVDLNTATTRTRDLAAASSLKLVVVEKN